MAEPATPQGQEPARPAEPVSGQEPQNREGQEPNPANGQEPSGGDARNSGETFSRDYVERLRREAAENRVKLREYEDATLSERDRLVREVTESRTRAETAESKLSRYEVAAAKGLPLNLAMRLQGSTREELEQDADRLKEEFGIVEGQEPVADFRPGTRPPSGSGGGDMNSLIRTAAGRSG